MRALYRAILKKHKLIKEDMEYPLTSLGEDSDDDADDAADVEMVQLSYHFAPFILSHSKISSHRRILLNTEFSCPSVAAANVLPICCSVLIFVQASVLVNINYVPFDRRRHHSDHHQRRKCDDYPPSIHKVIRF